MAKAKMNKPHGEITNFNIQLLADVYSSSTRESFDWEKQISVDPVSIKPAHSSKWEGKGSISSKFLSFSLPNSVTSSPLKQQVQKKKTKRKDGHVPSPLYRQNSVALTNLEQLRERNMRRSKSCGEGRTCQPSVDFDLLSHAIKINALQETEKKPADDHHVHNGIGMALKNSESFPCDQDDRFKCGALCLFLPGFGKNAKPVRSRKDIPHPADHVGVNEGQVVVSQRVSLEKFECGSWRSSAIIMNNEDDGDSASSMFFDLPMELIRCSNVNDAELPITTGFVFDKNTTTTTNNNTGKKGGLKNSSTINNTVNSNVASASRLLHSESMSNSCRHVHFPASSPTLYPASPSSCITPRLRKAREEFNAFLEAQNA
ncbi:uncharacterized protein [Henckelia pumila]|uniref:uncharacterized protein n=1 Tax=Henckelia pumila TaxID=405737 RepID=UPI003C6DCF7C